MDRRIVYNAQQPLEEDFLGPQRNAVVGLGVLSDAVIGRNITVDGLSVGPTTPTALAVNVSPGSIYAYVSLDAANYGKLPADLTHSVVKQGIMLDQVRIGITPPSTPGFSQTFLVQATFQEQDGGATVLPYFDSNNPSVALYGPNNSGTPQYTERNGKVVLQLKAGAPATTGSQVSPAADAGWVGLAWVTVASGAAVISAANITPVPGMQRITTKLPELGKLAGGSRLTLTGNGPFTITPDQAGLVIMDLGTVTGLATINLPPLSVLNGVPVRFLFLGRYLTPRSRRELSAALIRPASGDTFQDASHAFCGPSDAVEVIAAGNVWHWIRGKRGYNAYLNANASAQSIPNNVATAVILGGPPGSDTQPTWWNAANPTRLNIAQYAAYRVTAGVSFAANALTGSRELQVLVGGGTQYAPLPSMTVPAAPDSFSTLMVSSGELGLYDGDYIELYVRQTSGGPLNIRPSNTFLLVEMVEP